MLDSLRRGMSGLKVPGLDSVDQHVSGFFSRLMLKIVAKPRDRFTFRVHCLDLT